VNKRASKKDAAYRARMTELSQLAAKARAAKRAEREAAATDAWPLKDRRGARRSVATPSDCALVQAWLMDQLAADVITAAQAKQITSASKAFLDAFNENKLHVEFTAELGRYRAAIIQLESNVKDLTHERDDAREQARNALRAYEKIKAAQLAPAKEVA
jgi:cell division protein FtsB